MLRLTIRNIIEGQGALAKLVGGTTYDGKQILAPSCSAPMAYSLWLVRDGAAKQMTFFEEGRQRILVEMNAGNLTDEEVDKRYSELINTVVKIPNAGKIALSKLEAEGIKLNAVDLQLLDWLLKIDVGTVFEPDTQEEVDG